MIDNSTSGARAQRHLEGLARRLRHHAHRHRDPVGHHPRPAAPATLHLLPAHRHAETTTTTQYDKLTVKAGSTTLATYSNLNKAAGYTLRTFSLSALAGSTVTLKFSGTEDSSLQTSFVVDDTAVTVS